jgi:tetratricopeptide (TPR) repeat protein
MAKLQAAMARAAAEERHVAMAASRFLASLLALTAGVGAVAQDASPSNSQDSTSHHSGRHVQVQVDDDQATKLMQAERAIGKKDYAAAEGLLRSFVEKNPANYEAWFDLGFVENELGKVEESIAAYRKSVAAKPDVFESNLNLGLQLAKTGQPDAEKFLRAATQLKPTSRADEGRYRAWLSLAETVEKSNPDEALADLRRAEALQPKEPEAHLLAGRLLENENKFSDAETEYKQALALDALSADAAVGLANIYMRARRFPEAEEYLRKVLAAQGDSAPVRIQLGRVLAAEGKNDAAISEMQAGVQLAPGDDAAQRDLAELYTTAEKNDLAEATYRKLIVAHSNEAELHRRLGQALLREKKFPDAQKEFVLAIKLAPEKGEAYGDLAFAASENKDYPLVIRALEARAKLLPENAMTYFLRASAYDHLRDYKKAAANFHLFLNNANGKYPDYEWQAKHRLIAIEPKK